MLQKQILRGSFGLLLVVGALVLGACETESVRPHRRGGCHSHTTTTTDTTTTTTDTTATSTLSGG
jgi:hypothetical protein